MQVLDRLGKAKTEANEALDPGTRSAVRLVFVRPMRLWSIHDNISSDIKRRGQSEGPRSSVVLEAMITIAE
jgi:hypothetical protein